MSYCKNQVATKRDLIFTTYEKREREHSSLSRLELQSVWQLPYFSWLLILFYE